MYSQKQQKELIDLTAELLKKNKNNNLPKKDELNVIEDLRSVIRYHDWRYYVQSEAVISDFEYDQLFAWLRKLEEKYPEATSDDSPTQRVALGITKTFPEVSHLVPMLSLDNSYDADDLNDWDQR